MVGQVLLLALLLFPSGGASLQAGAGASLPGEELTLRSAANGKYVSAELGYGPQNPLYGVLRARSDVQGPWERWTKVRLQSGHWAIRNDANGRYVTVDLRASGVEYNELRATADLADLGPLGVFDLISNTDGTYTLQVADLDRDYYYVTVETSLSGPRYGLLRARNSSIGMLEKMTADVSAPSPELLGTPDFDGYCQMAGRGRSRLARNESDGWICSEPGGSNLDARAVCSWTYWTENVISRMAQIDDPYSWQCWRVMSSPAGPAVGRGGTGT